MTRFYSADQYVFSDITSAGSLQGAIDVLTNRIGCKVIGSDQNKKKGDWEIDFQKPEIDQGTGQRTGKFEEQTRKLIYHGNKDINDELGANIGENDLIYINGFFPLSGSLPVNKAQAFLRNIPIGGYLRLDAQSDTFPAYLFGLKRNPNNGFEMIKEAEVDDATFERAMRLQEFWLKLGNARYALKVRPEEHDRLVATVEACRKNLAELIGSFAPEDRDYLTSIFLGY